MLVQDPSLLPLARKQVNSSTLNVGKVHYLLQNVLQRSHHHWAVMKAGMKLDRTYMHQHMM
jgi:hypothetical protein